METLIVEPKNRKQLSAIKAFLKALDVSFRKDNEVSKELAEVIERGRQDAKSGRTTVIKSSADLWKLD
ncbi:hypothetical protein EON73_01385 [bacterium]|nr:MAG: hypothetical protein EON73_01385 [bacterium]